MGAKGAGAVSKKIFWLQDNIKENSGWEWRIKCLGLWWDTNRAVWPGHNSTASNWGNQAKGKWWKWEDEWVAGVWRNALVQNREIKILGSTTVLSTNLNEWQLHNHQWVRFHHHNKLRLHNYSGSRLYDYHRSTIGAGSSTTTSTGSSAKTGSTTMTPQFLPAQTPRWLVLRWKSPSY